MKESLEAILYYRASVTRDLYYQSVLGTVAHIYRAVADNTRAVACNEGTVAHNAWATTHNYRTVVDNARAATDNYWTVTGCARTVADDRGTVTHNIWTTTHNYRTVADNTRATTHNYRSVGGCPRIHGVAAERSWVHTGNHRLYFASLSEDVNKWHYHRCRQHPHGCNLLLHLRVLSRL